MRVSQTIALLRELDPEATGRPVVAPRHRPARRLVAVAAATAVIVAAGLSVSGESGPAPGFAERAHAALTAGDQILHLSMRSEFHFPADDPATTELWTRDGGSQLRVSYDGGEHEFARDSDRRYAASYVREGDRLTVHTDPVMWELVPHEDLSFAGSEGAARLTETLVALLARERDGDPRVQRLPDAVMDGREVAGLQTSTTIRSAPSAPADGSPPALEPVAVRTVVWFDLESHLPRRIERHVGERRESSVQVLTAERLPADEAGKRLLAIDAE